MTEELRNPDRRIEDGARRKLVRGAFAVPAVLTLYNGSSVAATSAASCLARQYTNKVSPSPYPISTPMMGADRYFRYQLWLIRKKADLSVVSHWIKGAELAAFGKAGHTPFLVGGWQQFVLSTNELGATTVARPEPPYDSTEELKGGVGPWIVLVVNGQGDIVGAGKTGDGSAVGESCWDSFANQTI